MRLRSRRAFTLMESIAAVMIVAVMVPPTLVMIRDSQVRRAGPILASRARWLASEKLEDIIADRHSADRGWDHVISSSYPEEGPVEGFEGFSRAVVITETGPDLVTAGSGYKRITATVSWMDPRHGNVSLSLSTVLTEHSP